MKSSISSIWYNSALELYKSGQLKESRKLLLNIHGIDPNFIPAIDLISIIDYQLANHDKALDWIELLLKSNPKNLDYTHRKCLILMKKGDIGDLTKLLTKSIVLESNHLGLLYTAVMLNTQAGKLDVAGVLLHKIPQDHEFYKEGKNYIESFYKNRNKLGLLLSEVNKKNDWARMLNIYLEFLEYNEPSADSFYNMGLIQMKLGYHTEAIQSFGKCMEYEPTFHIAALLYYWYNKLMICDWENYDDVSELLENEVSKYLNSSNIDYDIPIYILSFFEVSENLFKKCGTNYFNRLINRIGPAKSTLDYKNPKIRIGYLSSRFWAHPIGRVYKDIFKYHDRNRFEIFIYSTDHHLDTISREIIDGSDRFRDFTDMDSAESCSIIRSDQIDILVTVGGHGDDMKMDLVAMKPAPVMINAHGYNESLGGRFVDYLISDKEVLNNQSNFSEKPLLLPRCSIPSSTFSDTIIRNRQHFDLPEDMFIYVSAAHPRKITPKVFHLWEQILEGSTSSVLWIFDHGNKEVKDNLLKALENKELSKRILFSGMIPYSEHLGRFYLADLLLDTPIYNCHSVGMEALQCGLPFITVKGLKSNSRFGASMLKTAGLDDLICSSSSEYLDKALTIAEDPSKINEFKVVLKGYNTLFDTNGYVKDLEKSFLDCYTKLD